MKELLARRIKQNRSITPEILADLDRYLSEEFVESMDMMMSMDIIMDASIAEEPKERSRRVKPMLPELEGERLDAAPEAPITMGLDAAPEAALPADKELAYESIESIEDSKSIEDIEYSKSIEDVFGGLEETFQEKLLKTIDEKGLTDAQVYTRANLDRRLFSKIRCNVNYKPSKSTALALAIALGLDLDATSDLLSRAGLALSPSSKADLIVKYCIINHINDIMDVNALLYEYDQQLLGY